MMADENLTWFKKVAVSGAWFAYVRAADEAEVRSLHTGDLALFPHLAGRYPGAYTVEAMPSDFVPPEPFDSLQRGDFATFERMLFTGEVSPGE